ncbi:MAG: J domain-containing protein [Solirubrobacteraceae bacterium]
MPDPYLVLGLQASATDAELRAAYRRLVQLHHPDHNGGSAQAARRFEQVQEAYAEVRRRRTGGAAAAAPGWAAKASGGTAATSAAAATGDPDLYARLAAMEREVSDAVARDRAATAAARKAAARRDRERPSDEQLGYFSTDDSLTKIVDDAAADLLKRARGVRGSDPAHRLADLIDRLTGEPPERP